MDSASLRLNAPFAPIIHRNLTQEQIDSVIRFCERLITSVTPNITIHSTRSIEELQGNSKSKITLQALLIGDGKGYIPAPKPSLWLSQRSLSKHLTQQQLIKLIKPPREYELREMFDGWSADDFSLFKFHADNDIKKQYDAKQREFINSAAREATGNENFDCFTETKFFSEERSEDHYRKGLGNLDKQFHHIKTIAEGQVSNLPEYPYDLIENHLIADNDKGARQDLVQILELADARDMLQSSGMHGFIQVNETNSETVPSICSWLDASFKLAAAEDKIALANYRNAFLGCFPQEAAGRLKVYFQGD